MKTYKIKQSSQILFITTFLVVFLLGIYVTTSFGKSLPQLLVLIFFVALMIVAFLIAQYVSTAEIEIITDQNGIKKKWIKQFLFRNRPNISVDWEEISEYLFEQDRNWSTFEFVTKKGSVFQLVHSDFLDRKDDFLKFVRNFEAKVKKVNADEFPENDIKRAPTIYEGTTGLIIAIVGGLGALALIIAMMTTEKSASYFGRVAAILGIVYFIIQVYNHRKK